MKLFIPKGSNTEKYLDLDYQYYDTGFKTRIHVDNSDLDYSSEETQYKLLEFYDKLKRCYLCDERWFVEYSLESWYLTFNSWVFNGNCKILNEKKFTSFDKVIPSQAFYPCLYEFFYEEDRQSWKDRGKIRFEEEDLESDQDDSFFSWKPEM